MIGAAAQGSSPVHRVPAGAKLVILAVTAIAVAFLREPWPLAALLGATLALYGVARIRPRAALHALAPALWVLAISLPLNAWLTGWENALGVALRVVVVVGLAALVSLTTTVTAVLEAVQAALRPFPRVDADRVGLIIALTVRSIPLLSDIVASVLDARRARGAEGSLRALAVPVLVRSLKTADALGDALIARDADD